MGWGEFLWRRRYWPVHVVLTALVAVYVAFVCSEFYYEGFFSGFGMLAWTLMIASFNAVPVANHLLWFVDEHEGAEAELEASKRSYLARHAKKEIELAECRLKWARWEWKMFAPLGTPEPKTRVVNSKFELIV